MKKSCYDMCFLRKTHSKSAFRIQIQLNVWPTSLSQIQLPPDAEAPFKQAPSSVCTISIIVPFWDPNHILFVKSRMPQIDHPSGSFLIKQLSIHKGFYEDPL
jgi:hypothetical protein